MKEMTPYLTFNGNCREAMAFYADTLGAKLDVMTFADAKVPCPAGSEGRVMHARLTVGRLTLMASDSMPQMPFHQGNNFSISLNCSDAAEADRVFDVLGATGQTQTPLKETFFAARFGMLTDRFGVQWMINLERGA